MTWILTAFSLIKSGLSKAFAFAVKYPWPVFCAILAALALWLYVDLMDTKADLSAEKQARKADQAEWQRQVDQAKQVADKAKLDAKESANDAQEYHDQLSAANDGLDRYIASNRVRPKTCPAIPAGSSSPAQVPADPAPVSGVEVSEQSVRTCDALYSYSAASYRWGQELMEKGLAVK